LLSVVIPALNEELRLEGTIETVLKAAGAAQVDPFEIIIVNDGSTDKTADVIRRLESQHSFIRSIHFDENQGLGSGFRAAIKIAKYKKITTFPGDNCCRPEIMYKLFKNANSADLLLSFLVNTEERTPFRRLLSSIYSAIYILTFNLPIKYMNGSPIYSVEALRKLTLSSRRYGVFAEINVKLIRSGGTFAEVPDYVKPNQTKTSAIRMANLIECMFTFIRLVYEVRIAGRRTFAFNSSRVVIEFDAPPNFN
jgi:glycosyltransferase involved in cell wall biosynthesis